MDKKKIKGNNQEDVDSKNSPAKSDVISYRLKCARTANGLSHFIMYGDAAKEKSPL